jgi:hypothetical protein
MGGERGDILHLLSLSMNGVKQMTIWLYLKVIILNLVSCGWEKTEETSSQMGQSEQQSCHIMRCPA